MKNVLIVKSSILAGNSQSNQLSDYFVNQIQSNVTVRDVGSSPLPYFNLDAASATRGQPQTDEQKALLALSDSLVAELKNNDVVVINAPMYNFGIPAQLKSYFDFIARAGVTFRYTEKGAEGLITGKKAVVILTSGGKHAGAAIETMKQYVKDFLGFIGISDVQFAYADGLAMGEEFAESGKNAARAELDSIAKTL